MSSVLGTLLIAIWPLWAQVQDPGSIEVRLQNATPGGVVAGAAVTLAVMTEGGWQTERSAAADDQGRVVFSDLTRQNGAMYLPIVSYGGAWYYPPRPLDLSEEPSASADITVYDPTQSDQGLRYDRAAMLVMGVQSDALMMMEMSALNNTEPRTFVGQDGVGSGRAITARFPFPAGAVAVQPQAGLASSQITSTPDGLAMTWPVLPGRHELAFSYQLPYSGGQVTIDRILAYPVNTLTVYLPESSLRLASNRLTEQGTSDLGGQRYRVYTASNLDRGEHLQLQVMGVTAAVAPTSSNQTTTAVVLGAGAAALVIGLGLAFYWRKRSAQATPASDDESDRARLIKEIAALDERFAEGLLPETVHREAREALMRRVIALTPSSSQSSGASAESRAS